MSLKMRMGLCSPGSFKAKGCCCSPLLCRDLPSATSLTSQWLCWPCARPHCACRRRDAAPLSLPPFPQQIQASPLTQLDPDVEAGRRRWEARLPARGAGACPEGCLEPGFPALSKRSLCWGSLLKSKPKAALGPPAALTSSSLRPSFRSPRAVLEPSRFVHLTPWRAGAALALGLISDPFLAAPPL